MKELLNKIGLNLEGQDTKDGNYVIDLTNSSQFNDVFCKLDKCEFLEENEDSSVMNLEVSNILFMAEGFTLNLIADYSQNSYKLVITELKEDK